MKIIQITVVILVIIFSFLGMHSLILYFLFRNKENFKLTGGTLIQANHKKNVPIWGRIGHTGPLVVVGFFKNRTRTKYRYTVGQKTYTAKGTHYGTKRQSARIITVYYHKKIPTLAYIEDNEPYFGIFAFIYFGFALIFSLILLLL